MPFPSLRYLSTILFLLCFACAGSVYAEVPIEVPIDLDSLAARLTPEMDKAGVKSVVVTDFVVMNEKLTDLGWYLSDKLADSIVLKSPSVLVFDRTRLQQLGLASIDLSSADALKRIATATSADMLMSGRIEITPEKYILNVTLTKLSDGSTIASVAYPLPHSRILDLLSPAGDHASPAKPARAGVMGVGVPACLYCPVPAYTGRWRSNQPQNVLLTVIISIAGTAEKISVLQSPGYLMSEQAIEAVSEWKFRPAPGEDGKPTTVIVPIEVSFKTSRT